MKPTGLTCSAWCPSGWSQDLKLSRLAREDLKTRSQNTPTVITASVL
jgi:hypothetical protein